MLLPDQEMLVATAVEIGIHYIDRLYGDVSRSVSRWRERRSVETGEALKPYFQYAVQRASITKTLLHRATPVPLYDFYVDLDLVGPDGAIRAGNAAELFAYAPSLLLIGGAGTGKSTLLKHLFLDVLRNKLGLPIFVELRRFSDSTRNFRQFLYETVFDNGLHVSEQVFADLLSRTGVVLFLDGFDEVTHGRARQLALQMDTFDRNQDNIKIVVTSRPDYFRFIGWSDFKELRMMPLPPERSRQLVQKLKYDEERKASFLRAVDSSLLTTHASFLENPLLTTLMLMTYDKFGAIESRMHLFYSQVYETLYSQHSQHDATKVGFQRDMYSGLPADEFRASVAAFAVQTYFAEAVSFPATQAVEWAARIADLIPLSAPLAGRDFIEDLTLSVCLLTQDGTELRFTHRSFQEYFAAIFLLYFARKHRKDLLWQLRSRLNVDATAQLLMDMDRVVFEDDFLRPAIDSLRTFLSWDGDEDVGTVLLRFVRQHLQVSLVEGRLDVKAASDEAVANIGVVRFVQRAYYHEPFTWFEAREQDVADLRDILTMARVREIVAEKSTTAAEARQRVQQLPSLPILDTDFASPVMTTLLRSMFTPAARSLQRVLNVFEVMDSERQHRDAAMVRWLLRR